MVKLLKVVVLLKLSNVNLILGMQLFRAQMWMMTTDAFFL
jgi:hypothetical protein